MRVPRSHSDHVWRNLDEQTVAADREKRRAVERPAAAACQCVCVERGCAAVRRWIAAAGRSWRPQQL